MAVLLLFVAACAPVHVAPTAPVTRPITGQCVLERFTVQNDGLRLVAWLIMPTSGNNLPLVVFNFGVRFGHEAEPHINLNRPCDVFLHGHGFAVLIPERRGYGGSEGLPYSEFRGSNLALMRRLNDEARDVLAITDAVLAASTRIDRNRVVGVGVSLGGAITLFAAGERPELFRGVVAQGAGWDIHDPTHPLHTLMLDAMTRGAKAFPRPILFQHHPQDSVVPIVYSRTVHERLREAGRTNVFFHKLAVPTHELPLRVGRPEGHWIFGVRSFEERFFPHWGPEFLRLIDLAFRSN